MSILSDRLRQLRGKQSQSDMATPLGMKYQQWARYEKGEVSPSADLLAKICETHATSADWLLGLDNRKLPNTSVLPQPNCESCPFKNKLAKITEIIESS